MKKTINLHFITNYDDMETETLSKRNKYTHKNNIWNNITIDETKPADYWVIQNHPGKNTNYIPEKTLLFYNEPILTRKRWLPWANSQNWFSNYTERNWTGWGVSWDIDTFMTRPIFKVKEKSNCISTITSDLTFYPGHKLRLNMVKYMDNLDKFGIVRHIYGRKTKNTSILDTFKHYKGQLNYNKDAGLFPYHYHFMAENSQEVGYFSEKLIDPILTETLCFYYGAPNAKNYIHEKAFIELDLTRPNKSLEIIVNAMKNNEREKRLKYIKQAKKKILTELSIMPVIDSIINKK